MGNDSFSFKWGGEKVEVFVRNFNIRVKFNCHGRDSKWESVPFQYKDRQTAITDIKEYFE